MRFAFVSTILGYPLGGADFLWLQAAEAALEARHEILLALSPLTAEHPRIQALLARGARLHLRQRHTTYNGRRARWASRLGRLFGSPASLPHALDRFAPDLVLLNQGGTHDFLVEDGLVEQLARARRPTVIICQSNDDDHRLAPADQERSARSMSAFAQIVFVSTHNKLLAERQIKRPLPNAVLVHNPSRPDFATPLPWPDQPPFGLATVGRLENRDKGFDLLLPALAAALGPEPGWRLNLYGSGPDEAALRALAEESGLADRCHFHGRVSDIASIWRANHLLLLPSRREGCSLAMMEALRCGRPVLATPVGGVSDWVTHDVNGFVAPARDVASLTDTLRHAWAARDRWPVMGSAAHQAASTMDAHPGHTLLHILTENRVRARQP